MKTVIEKRVRAMRWRLEWLNFCFRFVRLLFVALVLLTIYILAEKFFELPWGSYTFASLVIGATLPLALFWAVLTRTNNRNAAIVTDEKLSLRERLSTALRLGVPVKPMEQAVMVDAEVHARPLRAHRVFPMPIWREFYYMPFPLIAIVMIAMFVPQYRLFPGPEKQPDKPITTRSQQELQKRIAKVQSEIKNIKKASMPIPFRELSADMEQMRKDLEAKRLTRTDLMKRLSNMADRMAERKTEIEKKIAEAQKLERIQSAQHTKKLIEAMTKGNFDQAKAELEKLSQKLQDGSMSKKDQQKLAKELKALSDALKENSQLSQMLASAAQCMQQGNMGQAGQNLQMSAREMQSLAETLAQMGQLDQLSQQLQGLAQSMGNPGRGSGESELIDGLGQLQIGIREMGEFRTGETDKFGPGMGGPGKGAGGRAGFQQTNTAFKSSKTRMKMQPGDIIGMIRVWGPQLKGDANLDFEDAFLEYSQTAEDTMTREHIPLEFRNIVKDYFDAIRPSTMAEKPVTDGAAEDETESESP